MLTMIQASSPLTEEPMRSLTIEQILEESTGRRPRRPLSTDRDGTMLDQIEKTWRQVLKFKNLTPAAFRKVAALNKLLGLIIKPVRYNEKKPPMVLMPVPTEIVHDRIGTIAEAARWTFREKTSREKPVAPHPRGRMEAFGIISRWKKYDSVHRLLKPEGDEKFRERMVRSWILDELQTALRGGLIGAHDYIWAYRLISRPPKTVVQKPIRLRESLQSKQKEQKQKKSEKRGSRK